MAALEVSVHGVGGLMNSFDGAYSLVAHKSAIEPKTLFPQQKGAGLPTAVAEEGERAKTLEMRKNGGFKPKGQ